MKVEELAPPAEWKDIQSLFSNVTGFTSITCDSDGNPVTDPRFQNEFCKQFTSTEIGMEKHIQVHKEFMKRVFKTKKPIVDKCSASGLLKVVVPIIYNSRVIGMTGGCGVYLKSEGLNLVKLLEAGEEAGMESREVKKHVKTIKMVDEKTIQHEISVINAKLNALVSRKIKSISAGSP